MECQSCPLGCVAKKGQKFKAAGSREGTRVGLTRQGARYATCGTKSLVVGNWRDRPGNTADIWISLEVDAPTTGTQLSLVTPISHRLEG